MEQIHASALEAENKVRTLESDGMRLKLYQDMLTNISTQATLLLGFSLSTYGADMLPQILDDSSSFCFYKDGWTMFFGSIFLFNNTASVCLCLLVILFSSYFILKSQTALLYVGGSAAVWRTHQLSYYVYKWYAYSLCVFILNAMLLMWVFLGFGLWRQVDSEGAEAGGGWDIETKLGYKYIRCLDLENDEHHAGREWFGKINGIISQLAFAAFIRYGWVKFQEFERLFNVDALHGSDAVRREEAAERAREQLSTDLNMARIRQDEATKELKKIRRHIREAEKRSGMTESPTQHGTPMASAAVREKKRLKMELAKCEHNLEKAEKKVAKAKAKLEADRSKRQEQLIADGGVSAVLQRTVHALKSPGRVVRAKIKMNLSRSAARRAQMGDSGAASPATQLFSPASGPPRRSIGSGLVTPPSSTRHPHGRLSPPLEALLKTAEKAAPGEEDSMC